MPNLFASLHLDVAHELSEKEKSNSRDLSLVQHKSTMSNVYNISKLPQTLTCEYRLCIQQNHKYTYP